MIISPARFEDMVNQCLESDADEYTKREIMGEIIVKTLTSMGYGAGIDRITDYLKNDR